MKPENDIVSIVTVSLLSRSDVGGRQLQHLRLAVHAEILVDADSESVVLLSGQQVGARESILAAARKVVEYLLSRCAHANIVADQRLHLSGKGAAVAAVCLIGLLVEDIQEECRGRGVGNGLDLGRGLGQRRDFELELGIDRRYGRRLEAAGIYFRSSLALGRQTVSIENILHTRTEHILIGLDIALRQIGFEPLFDRQSGLIGKLDESYQIVRYKLLLAGELVVLRGRIDENDIGHGLIFRLDLNMSRIERNITYLQNEIRIRYGWYGVGVVGIFSACERQYGSRKQHKSVSEFHKRLV